MGAGNGNPSPTIKENALAIKVQMEAYAKPRGGIVKIMANMRHLYQEVYELSEAPKILICWTGETARGEYAGGERTNLHRVDRHWVIVIMRGHGFKALIEEGIGKPGTPGAIEDFADSVETIRDGCRVLQGISEEYPNDYKGTEPLPNVAPGNSANVYMDCFQVKFSTAADIPAIDGGVTV